MKLSTSLGIVLLASSTTFVLAQPGGGEGRGGGRQGDPQQFIDRMMERDANGDGVLTRDEIEGPFADRLFEADADGDGKLTRDELVTGMEQMRQRSGDRGQRGERGDRPGGPAGGGVQGAPGAGGASGAAGTFSAMSFDQGMQMAGRALRQLRRSEFNDESRASDLRNIHSVQMGLLTAKSQSGHVPMAPQAKARYGDDAVKYESDFRLTLIEAIMESMALEMSVIQGDTEGAKTALEHLLAAQQKGHDAFESEEEAEDDAGARAIPEPARGIPGRRGDG